MLHRGACLARVRGVAPQALWRPFGLRCRASRLFFSTVATSPSEQVSVDCRSNGKITLNIHHPLTGQQPSPIILYLPPGPVVEDNASASSADVPSTLAAYSQAIVVQINYRLSENDKFPTPVHDVLAGYDWVLENLLGSKKENPDQAERIPIGRTRLGVCGELVGGSLATMLALTECRLGSPRIGAAAVNNPIVEWLFMDLWDREAMDFLDYDEIWPKGPELARILFDHASKPKKKRRLTSWSRYAGNKELSGLSLVEARRHFFKKPEDLFDRFASPLFFFRSPDADLIREDSDDLLEPPKDSTTERRSGAESKQSKQTSALSFEDSLDDLAELAESNYSTTDVDVDEFHDVQHSEPPANSFDGPVRLQPRRKFYRAHPPAGSRMELPDFHVGVGSQVVLLDQVKEFVIMTRRAIAKDYLKKTSTERRAIARLGGETIDPEVDDATALGEKKVQLTLHPNVGLWTGQQRNAEWKDNIKDIATWFKASLTR